MQDLVQVGVGCVVSAFSVMVAVSATKASQASGGGSIPLTRSEKASLSATDSEAFLMSGQDVTTSDQPTNAESLQSVKVTGRDPDCPAWAVHGGSTGGSASGTSEFTATLAMIERLPLSDDEKAEAVRRLLARPGN